VKIRLGPISLFHSEQGAGWSGASLLATGNPRTRSALAAEDISVGDAEQPDNRENVGRPRIAWAEHPLRPRRQDEAD
jgi:hypothetical protein